MLVLLSPAKTLDPNPVKVDSPLTYPEFVKEANYLAGLLKKSSLSELQELFQVSPDLARLNFQRYRMWDKDFTTWDYAPAILTFSGEVFRGLNAPTLSSGDLSFAQSHIRIMSGLYGILRPLDNIRPYRLEMATELNNRRGKNLYDFWKKDLTRYVGKELEQQNERTIIHLASGEYAQAIDFKKLKARVVQVSFKDFKNGKYKFLTVYGKNARGKMARFLTVNRITNPEDLKAFDSDGYILNTSLSSGDHLVFTRG